MHIAIIMATRITGNYAAEAGTASLYDRVIPALIKVESHGDDHVIGDRHMQKKAYGSLQIRKPCVDDVNRRLGTRYRPEDMLGDRSLSALVCREYLKMYGTRERLGREPTEQDLARIWNGGPNGWRKQSTLGYWSKVQKVLATK
ncbi:MAG: hypothetical protein AAB470_02440 [Patescibacteria group bacterium]